VETLDTKRVYANPWMSVREDTVRRPDGSTGIYAVVDTPDIALIVPSDQERLHLVEQYRYPVAGRRWEFPSGTADPALDADPEALARRELREETGLVASALTPLGTLEVAPSLVNHQCRVFLATGLSQGKSQRDPEEQDMRSAWFRHSDVHRMIADGDITDAKSIAAFALLLVRA
jgi:8-oxo-dGTP pyrophosphatase MutT (NUDIX family)